MTNKKKMQRIIIALLLIVCAMGPVKASATNYDFSFYFNNLNNKVTETVKKADSEQKWYVSIDMTYDDIYSTLSDDNILGLRMNKNGSYVSNYHTFSRFVSKWPLAYTTTVYAGDSMYMGAKKDSSSTSSTALRVFGRFCP